jgi:murein L,D-transpeptidase YafK
MSRGFKITLAVLAVAAAAGVYIAGHKTVLSRFSGAKSVADRIEETQAAFDRELAPRLTGAGLGLKPESVTLFFKDQKVLHLYAGQDVKRLKLIKSYKVTAASGQAGPKLREGDRQVPEGLYRIESLNPNSRYYLSLRVNYPNAEDRAQAGREGRTQLGGDIMIHGSRVSIGCIAIGDEAIAELFHLAAVSDYSRWRLLLAPTDFRSQPFPRDVLAAAPWMKNVYDNLKTALAELP